MAATNACYAAAKQNTTSKLHVALDDCLWSQQFFQNK
jgi:hypothetical protein